MNGAKIVNDEWFETKQTVIAVATAVAAPRHFHS